MWHGRRRSLRTSTSPEIASRSLLTISRGAGAGLVRVAVPDACLETVASYEPCYTTLPLPCDADGRLTTEAEEPIVAAAAQATVVALGPGLGRCDALRSLVNHLYRRVDRPMVVDADGLNNLAALGEPPSAGGPRILTPHPGEFVRLLGAWRADAANSAGSSSPDADDRRQAAVALAKRLDVVVVLKGHGTLITDGSKQYVNRTGNPGLSTGGTGDVLTGMIAALCAQGLEPLDAARLGAHLHGLAGDLAADDYGEVPIIASDLLEFFPEAFQTVTLPE